MEWDFADPLARITGAFIGNKHFTVRAYRQSSNPWHTDIPEVHFGAHNLGLGPLCVVQHPHGTERERFSDCSVVVWDSFASLDALQRQSHNAATLAYDLPQIGPKLAPAVSTEQACVWVPCACGPNSQSAAAVAAVEVAAVAATAAVTSSSKGHAKAQQPHPAGMMHASLTHFVLLTRLAIL